MDKKIDYEEISRLVGFLEEKNLTHFELEVEGFKIKISRGAHSERDSARTDTPVNSVQTETEDKVIPVSPLPQESSDGFHFITSPMVGTFYRAPDPASPPFVDLGDEVKKTQTLCIIEAMKLMNEIESEVDGVIAEIFAENGKPVEYGQKLFAIRPTV
jgi:acetyl-CoA carboxylase biotin carboxyl carrier protein